MKNRNIDFDLYLITNRKLVTHHTSLIMAVRKSLLSGVKAVQLREKDIETRELLKLASKMRDLTAKYDAKLFINDRFDIALAVGADGVHLTQKSIPADAVRKALKNKLLIGVSTHSLKEAKEAEKGGADFITFGPVYKTPSKLKYGEPLGIDVLKDVSRKIKIPVFALGGVKAENIDEVKKSGAFGAAMISEILCAVDIKEKTRELINILGE
ncbi:MAG: thiamine phosphate synthase [Thermodesulfovibrionia bacterium]|nr:thiamine phosphate synthase [Thermodesulfovibrionia bacterium]